MAIAHGSGDSGAQEVQANANEDLPAALDGLDEITGWLVTYRNRLRIAHDGERLELSSVVRRLKARYQRRRAELA